MNTIERKWRANMEKVAFAKEFPAMLRSAADAEGRDVREVVVIDEESSLQATLFTDGTFVLEGSSPPNPADIMKALWTLRERLEPFHREAYAQLDALAAADRELTRQARKENILGAIRNNIAALPELYDEIPKLLDELRSGAPPTCSSDDPQP